LKRALTVFVFFALVFPPVSLAHGGGSQHGWVSTIQRIVNANGIQAQASGDGHFTFTAPSGKTVVVLGYEREPYLRFAGGKIYENANAPTTYVNREEPAPAEAMVGASPAWRKVGNGRTYTWHDHRTHWMASKQPAAVERAPDESHHVSDWKVEGTVGGTPFTIVGSLDWAATKSGLGWQWLLVPVALGGVAYALFLTFFARRRRSPQQQAPASPAGRARP
jgi:hypothetical protein